MHLKVLRIVTDGVMQHAAYDVLSTLNISIFSQPYLHGRFPITMMMKLARRILSFRTQLSSMRYNALFCKHMY